MDDYTRSRFVQAVKKFNDEDFLECHEILEDIWFDIRDDSRNFYQGLLHFATAFYHLKQKNNPKGAVLQLKKGLDKLAVYGERYNGIDLDILTAGISNINKNLFANRLPTKFPKIVVT